MSYGSGPGAVPATRPRTPEKAPVDKPVRTSRSGRSARLRPSRNVLYLTPALVFLLVLGAYPLEELFRMSLSKIETSTIVNSSWPWAGLDNYRAALSAPAFHLILWNTVELVAISVVATLVGGLVAAIIVERNTFTNRLTQGVLVFLWAMPPLVVGFIWKFLLSSDGLIPVVLVRFGVGTSANPTTLLAGPHSSLIVIALVSAWVGSAFASLIFRASMLGVDVNLVEAALLDGAGTWGIFRNITLPALRPALLVQSLLTVIYGFRIFDLSYVMSSGGPGQSSTTLPYWAYQKSFGELDFASGSAIAVLCVGLVLVFAVFYLYATREETR